MTIQYPLTFIIEYNSGIVRRVLQILFVNVYLNSLRTI